MPDIANRTTHEKEMALAVLRSWADIRGRFARSIGDPPDLENIPEGVWRDLQQATEDRMRETIAIMFLLGTSSIRSQFPGFEINESRLESLSLRYADSRAREVSRGIVDTLQDRLSIGVAEARARIEEGRRPVSDILADLQQQADATITQQAETVGTTETTAANSAGEMSGRDEIQGQMPKNELLTAHWAAERDGKTCAICRGLDTKSEWQWQDDYPLGPPAHPNCRCYLVYVVEQEP